MAYEPKTWVKGETVTPLALNNMENALAEANGDYVPHEWECGEVVTADLLNHIEQGIAEASQGGGGDDPTVGKFTVAGSSITFGGSNTKGLENVILPSNVKTLESGCFAGLTTIKKVVGEGLETVGAGAIHGIAGLQYVYFGANVTSIGESAVNTSANCIIDCGFAEGAVSGAPWGAQNATINYNVPAPRDL